MQLVDAALEILTADGVAGLTMKSIADRTGGSAAGMYRHVEGKTQILDLCAGALMERIPTPQVGGGKWTDAMRTYAWSWWGAVKPHPWSVPFLLRRGPDDVVNQPHFAFFHAAFRDAGFSESEARLAIGFFVSFLVGSLVAHANVQRGASAAGLHRAEDHFSYGLEGVLRAIEDARVVRV